MPHRGCAYWPESGATRATRRAAGLALVQAHANLLSWLRIDPHLEASPPRGERARGAHCCGAAQFDIMTIIRTGLMNQWLAATLLTFWACCGACSVHNLGAREVNYIQIEYPGLGLHSFR